MSADILRRAADLMRARAEAATPGPWAVPDADDEYVGPTDVVSDCEPGERYIICEHAGVDATHIASWHPAVALAVADWIDTQARDLASADGHLPFCDSPGDVDHALAVARAYLNEGDAR